MALWLLPIQTDQASNCYFERLSALYDPRPFPDIADGLVGVGLITSSEDCPGVLTLDKGYNEMSKFLNRILGMHVEKQNLLFKYFSDTLAAIISQAKRSGRFDDLEKKTSLLSYSSNIMQVRPRDPRRRHDQGGSSGVGEDALFHEEARHWQGQDRATCAAGGDN